MTKWRSLLHVRKSKQAGAEIGITYTRIYPWFVATLAIDSHALSCRPATAEECVGRENTQKFSALRADALSSGVRTRFYNVVLIAGRKYPLNIATRWAFSSEITRLNSCIYAGLLCNLLVALAHRASNPYCVPF